MEHQKMLNLLNEANDSKFFTRKWNIVNDNSKANYGIGNEITYKTQVLKSSLCDNNNAYILVTGDITIIGDNGHGGDFKNCAPFIKYITKTDGTTIGDAEDLDLVMSMYNLREYSTNYSETTRSLWFYFKNKAIDFHADIANDDNFKSCKYKLNY